MLTFDNGAGEAGDVFSHTRLDGTVASVLVMGTTGFGITIMV